jgi:hypothetical protein
MKSLHEPELYNAEEFGATAEILAALAAHVASNTEQVSLDHSHGTSRDGRQDSLLRRTEGLLSPTSGLEPGLQDQLKAIYGKLAVKLGSHLNKPVYQLPSSFAAVGHLYTPGDDTTEAHVDYYPSATLYMEVPSDGGQLIVATDPDVQTIWDIMSSEPWVVPPKVGHVALFDGQHLPHYVNEVPGHATGRRVSINFSFASDDRPIELGPENYGEGYFTQFSQTVL